MSNEKQPGETGRNESGLPDQVVGFGFVVTCLIAGFLIWGSDDMRKLAFSLLAPALLACFPLWSFAKQQARTKADELHEIRLQTQAGADAMRRQEVAAAYRSCARILQDVTAAETDEKKAEVMGRFFREDAPILIVHGSDDVVLAVNRWRDAAEQPGRAGSATGLAAWADLLRAMRADAYPQGADLSRIELLRVVLNDSRADIDDLVGSGGAQLDQAFGPFTPAR